jgi:hypothetical protein
LNTTKEKLVALSIVILSIFIFTGIAVALENGPSAEEKAENTVQTESNTIIVVEELPTTTTTTIDLSFLNTTTTTAPPQVTYTAPKVEPNFAPGDSVWDELAICESGGNWAYPPVSGGFSGGIMFHIGTWRSNGGNDYAPDAYLASREEQIIIAERVLAGSGWGAWPGCSRKLGLR